MDDRHDSPLPLADPFLGTVLKGSRVIDKYSLTEVLGHGNSGEVYGVRRDGNERPLALKVFMPFFEARQLSLFDEIDAQLTQKVLQRANLAETEYRFLERIDHPFVVDVFDSGTFELTADEGNELRRQLSSEKNPEPYTGRPFTLPYIVTSKVNGRPLDKALHGMAPGEPAARSVVRTLISLAQGLEYLHEHHRYLHADVKAANVMIRSADGLPVLIDFALCKNLNFNGETDPTERITLNVDWSLTPDEQVKPSHPFHQLIRNGGTRQEIHDQLFPWLDFFQFGMLLRQTSVDLERLLPAGSHGYLHELIDKLTTWEQVVQLKQGGLVPLVERIAVTELYSAASPAPLEDRSNMRYLPGGRRVVWDPALTPITQNISLNRLSGINQLSLLPAVLPGATHTRLLHVYETLRVTQRAVRSLANVPAFRSRYGSDEVQQLLAMALLHDINHMPFLHLFQESELPGITKWKVVDLMADGEATGERAKGQPSVFELLAAIGLDSDRFKRVVLGDWTQQSGEHLEVDQLSNSLLKSGVDVDKLSYLPLDSESTGSGTARGLSVGGLLDSLDIVDATVGHQVGPHIAFRIDALPDVEVALAARYWSFVNLYWSADNRAMMALFFHVVRRLLTNDREVSEFLSANIFSTDRQLIAEIERSYVSRFGVESGLLRMIREPHTRPIEIAASREILDHFKRLSQADLPQAIERLGQQLYSDFGSGLTIQNALVDLPARELDLGGRVFLSDGTARPIAEVSGVARDLAEQYRNLSRRARVFVPPDLAEAIYAKLGRNSVVEHIHKILHGDPPQLQ